MPDTTTPAEAFLAELVDPTTVIIAHLAKSVTVDPDNAIDLASFVEADFSGYQAQRITDLEIVSSVSDPNPQALSIEVAFVADDGIEPQGVVAVYLSIQTSLYVERLLWVQPLDTPYVFEFPGDGILRQIRLTQILP
jgi:hypothetical protein